MEQNPYRLTDKAIELLTERAVKRFEQAKAKANVAHFDELNVIQTVRELYEELRRDNEEIFLELAQESYVDSEPHGNGLVDLVWLLALLAAYDPVTKYIYDNEVERKRDRLEEAVNASSAKSPEYQKALGLWVQMTAQYADTVTDKSVLKAYEDAGVKFVRWVAEQDSKTCSVCRKRHGKIYPINMIPSKPHWQCRCTFKPFNEK